MFTDAFGRLLGLEETQTIEGFEPVLAAPWAHDAPAWVLFGCIGLIAAAVVFYARYQRHKPAGARVVLAACRATVLCLLLLLLAEPILTVTVTSQKRPALWFLFDGTESMSIADEFSDQQRAKLAEAVGLDQHDGEARTANGEPAASDTEALLAPLSPRASLGRIDYLKALLQRSDGNLLQRLAAKYRLRAFLFDQLDGVRTLELAPPGEASRTDAEDGDEIDGDYLAEQLTADGEVTALGEALDDLARRHATANLAGLVIFSDFDQNSGQPALAAASRLGTTIYTVGVGAAAAVDIAVSIQSPLILKKSERATITVTLRQQGLEGEEVRVSLAALPLDPSGDETTLGAAEPLPIDEKPVMLSGASVDVDFQYVPEQTGRFALLADVAPVMGEVIEENNRARREVTVRDDFLRLLYVEYEPTWEWRFVKEVFHRDKLVGTEGFRTFLRSSDPRVRDTSAMFLPTMSPPRSEFFAHDVIFLGDLPASALSPRFCQMTEEFVRNFGGGLVVVSGPRFGPGQLADTPLARLLPVKVDPAARVFDRQPFRLKLTAHAAQYDFMQLGSDERESRKAWDNLGLLPWYQPVERLHPLATALAEHPTRTCVDGKTRQPLIAVRRYGRGEVIYLGFNETWRLRRQYGELYYRQFWGQMIHRLGLSHALGSQKRFVVQTDRRRYQADDQVLLTVEACNADFEPLGEEDLPDRRLQGELVLPSDSSASGGQPGGEAQRLSISQLRKGVFEARFPVFAAGEHRVRVRDPITGKPVETTFKVTSVAVERQNAVRNVALQQQIADVHAGGRSCGLADVNELAERIQLTPKTETTVEIITLWNTWLCFACVVGLLLVEWLVRKWVNLP
ncbi:MAG: VWA domain-containing protein [Pirellulales bacterium]|nr:VWA domain-containing protein [Pirellulales bacterium]